MRNPGSFASAGILTINVGWRSMRGSSQSRGRGRGLGSREKATEPNNGGRGRGRGIGVRKESRAHVGVLRFRGHI